MRRAKYSSQFYKDYSTVEKRGYDMSRLISVMKSLENEEILSPKYKQHPLNGRLKGFLECHIEPDWLIMYRLEADVVYFARTGTHSDLFR